MLIFGAIVVVAAVIIYSMRSKQAAQQLAANSPGAPGYYGGRMPVTSAAIDNTLGGLLSSVGSGMGGLFHGSGFATPAYPTDSAGLNDPGLDTSSSIDYAGDDNSALVDDNAYQFDAA